jgi:hypothetical protein
LCTLTALVFDVVGAGPVHVTWSPAEWTWIAPLSVTIVATSPLAPSETSSTAELKSHDTAAAASAGAPSRPAAAPALAANSLSVRIQFLTGRDW